MNTKTFKIIIALIIMILVMAVFIPKSIGRVTPTQIDGHVSGSDTIDLGFVDKLEDMIRGIGSFIAVGAMMIIGIRYITGSIEEKASYKKSMMPYLIGCFILFGAANLAPQIIDLFKTTTTAEAIGNKALSLIQGIGTFISIGTLMMLGIKYMMGSVEEKASYKKTMIPYAIGAVLLFSAVHLTKVIYDVFK